MNPLILLACAVGLLSLLSLAVILWLLRLRGLWPGNGRRTGVSAPS